MKIADLIDEYEQGAKLRGIAPTQLMALRPIRRSFGGWTAAQLTPAKIATYVGARRKGMHTNAHAKKPASDGTIRRELGALSAVLNWAADKRLVKRDDVPTIDMPPASPPREVFLTQTEADELWRIAVSYLPVAKYRKAALFTCLALDTWARANAIETLTWSRVNLHARQIDYRDPARRVTAKRRVAVPLSERLWEVLNRECMGSRFEDAVVGAVTQYEWQRFIGQTRWPHITRHDLRRTGASCAVARGVDIMKVAQMLGDSYETTLKHYARFAPDYLADVYAPRRVLNSPAQRGTVEDAMHAEG